MRSLEARLQRLDQAAKRQSPFRENLEFEADLDCIRHRTRSCARQIWTRLIPTFEHSNEVSG
jgi:hypothetical protein